MKTRIFQRADWLCGLISALVAFAVYAWTTAPNVTLLDSGEFLVAATRFGVPHPTGYPLWTFLSWLFHLIPLGNSAWQVALFSGVCGALAVGLTAMLIRNAAVWMFPAAGLVASICAVSLALTFAFSFSMWSQCVIVEVYALHALLVGLYLTSLYLWLRRPERMSGLYWSFFLLALSFSNHQLTLALAILPFLIVILLRWDLFWDLCLAAAVCVLISYLGFALLADNPTVLKAAIRLCWMVATILAIALFLKRGRLQWRLIVFLPIVLFLGLLPYAYSPIASSTNPPMNWGYTRTPAGFFASFNRSQYSGTLSALSLRVFSKTLGVLPDAADSVQTAAAEAEQGSSNDVANIRKWVGLFWYQTFRSFSPIVLLFFLAAFIGALRMPLPVRVWIYLLVIAFSLAMCLQPALEHATTDNDGWWVQMPYHTYTNLIFAVLCGIGAVAVFQWLSTRAPALRHSAWVLLLLPLWPLKNNADGASQRNHWFGWEFGHDILKDLSKGAVLFGGTDPGRFIPTYMIFGESSLPPGRKIDPSFDRSDVYIITQNALGDRFYANYIDDQYGASRPPVTNAFERWLGREHAYPPAPLVLPTIPEMHKIEETGIKAAQKEKPNLTVSDLNEIAHSAVAEWIFQKNKATHAFYVEESFKMEWSYPYAIPDGLIYRLNPEPLAKLPADAVQKDFAYWTSYIAHLQADPAFAKDYDAQRTFSKLRMTAAHIYAFRHMNTEAEAAYQQAIALWPDNPVALREYSKLLWDRHELDVPITLSESALEHDPDSMPLLSLRILAEQHKVGEEKVEANLAKWRRNPSDIAPLQDALSILYKLDEEDQIDPILKEAIQKIGNSPDFLKMTINLSNAEYRWQQASDAAVRWTQVDPKSAEAFYQLATAQFRLKQQKESVANLATALRLGGVEYRERIFSDPVFESLKDFPEFQKLEVAPPPTPTTGK